MRQRSFFIKIVEGVEGPCCRAWSRNGFAPSCLRPLKIAAMRVLDAGFEFGVDDVENELTVA